MTAPKTLALLALLSVSSLSAQTGPESPGAVVDAHPIPEFKLVELDEARRLLDETRQRVEDLEYHLAARYAWDIVIPDGIEGPCLRQTRTAKVDGRFILVREIARSCTPEEQSLR